MINYLLLIGSFVERGIFFVSSCSALFLVKWLSKMFDSCYGCWLQNIIGKNILDPGLYFFTDVGQFAV